MIPEFDLRLLQARDAAALTRLREAAEHVGFLTLRGTDLAPEDVRRVLTAYGAFFRLPPERKAQVDMARTGANRGWGAPQSEQVDPNANPDFKEVFDCGVELAPGDPWAGRGLAVYAPNLWPDAPDGFQTEIETYFAKARAVAMEVLRAIAVAMGARETWFDPAFERPMALLRGNYYPARPQWAAEKDFGIAPHTDYGCLTLLATDGAPGLEVLTADGTWTPVAVQPGTFVINFGEMLEMWTNGQVKATLHRVIGGTQERLSVPLFFNPSYEADVAPPGASEPIKAGPHLARRYDETYLHLKEA
ncbi:isopenicillin N synthase family oxygenase [Thalassococcus sp. S3]|uniref:isopenicillin N synthase family dioxygenase n=1 Tax=Thalassococcus sp. S3 TaxID=2017482 RepID=UPI0010243194|nr:2OG-Fe(II) oxygenase family protein [Thalassococcus sp. S3]QBF31435.1 oxidoreductase [Thalassococcus sp. S3]